MTTELEKKTRQARALINDAFAFVKSQEVNRSLSEVSLDDLLEELIIRNGESEESNKSGYDPYSYNEAGDEPAEMPTVTKYGPAGNPVSGTDFQNPTKLDRLLALKLTVESTIEGIKQEDPFEIAITENPEAFARE